MYSGGSGLFACVLRTSTIEVMNVSPCFRWCPSRIGFIKVERSVGCHVCGHQATMGLNNLRRPWQSGSWGEERESWWNLSTCGGGHGDGGNAIPPVKFDDQ